jgi:hypothetical protein
MKSERASDKGKTGPGSLTVLPPNSPRLTYNTVSGFSSSLTPCHAALQRSHHWASIRSQFGKHEPGWWSKKWKKKKNSVNATRAIIGRCDQIARSHTDASNGVARATRALPEVARRTMRVLVMLIPDVAEKVNLVRAGEERGSDRMNGCVAPPLFWQSPRKGGGGDNNNQDWRSGRSRVRDASYLVVKASLVIEVIEVR